MSNDLPPHPAMTDSLNWISARTFVPRGATWLLWKALGAISPLRAARYLERSMRDGVRHARKAEITETLPLSAIAPFGLSIGIARAADILCSAFQAADHHVHRVDCSAVVRVKARPSPGRENVPAHGTLIFCVNPPELGNVLRHFGPRYCRGKRLIGYWWWELDRLPADWLPWAALMDEIWVSSHYVYETFARDLPEKSVRFIQLPIPEPIPSSAGRQEFGLHPDRFTVLVVFDLASGWHRKNPQGAIEAFRRAFPHPADAQLVIKVNSADRYVGDMGRLCALTVDMPNVRIIHQTLSAGDLAALIRCSDAFLSLHRAEGLGLVIAEAMWLGTPVIATGWSGVLDMLDAESALLVRYSPVPVKPAEYRSAPPGATWADPDLDDAARALRLLAADSGLRARLASVARRRAEHQFDIQQFREIVPTLVRPLSHDG